MLNYVSGLLVFAVSGVCFDAYSVLVLRPERFLKTVFVERNYLVCRVEDFLCGAIILFQLENFRIGEIGTEFEQIVGVGSPPAVNRLVVVPHNEYVSVGGCKHFENFILNSVGVLKFVYADVRISPLIFFKRLRKLPEQTVHVEKQIVEVHGVGLEKSLVVFRHYFVQFFPVVRRAEIILFVFLRGNTRIFAGGNMIRSALQQLFVVKAQLLEQSF